MKYSQLVHMPGDVKHWLEKQLKTHEIDGDLYAKYLISLLEESTLNNTTDHMFGALDAKNKCHIDCLIEDIVAKLKEIKSREDSSRFDISSGCDTDTLAMDSSLGFACRLNGGTNCMEPIRPCLPPKSNSRWTRDLLHDSAPEIANNKMDDFFPVLFYDNPATTSGLNESYGWTRAAETRRNGPDGDRIDFYNRQNLLASEYAERSVGYEGNPEMDKLIAKFDANVEEIWKGSSDGDGPKYPNLQNIFACNPYVRYGSNVVWAFEEKQTTDGTTAGDKVDRQSSYKSSFSHWTSPIFPGTGYEGFDTVLSAFNATLSNMQKWSSVDGRTEAKGGTCFGSEVTGQVSDTGTSHGYQYRAPEPMRNSQEEEDLLTSAKTHFRPIRMDELGSSSQTGIYADGTTFAISNDLDKVAFKRSESGLLYIEADAETPRKYMEFKEKENGTTRADWESDASSTEEFVPKFRVRQSNEKCVQTDDLDEEVMAASGNDTDCDSVSYKSDEDEFYFPGDDELAQNIINAIEEEEEEEEEVDDDEEEEDDADGKYNKEERGDNLEMSLYKVADLKACHCGGETDWNQNFVASDTTGREREWSQIWKTQADTCDGHQSNMDKLSTRDRFRFREELTREGEQLLLDLNCLQQMYSNSDWCDDDSTTASDFNDEEEMAGPEPSGYPGKGAWWSRLIAKEEPMKNGFDLRCLWTEEKLFPELTGNGKKKPVEKAPDRPVAADARQTERKRRNSSSQKACNLYLEGQCRRPHCRFAHCDSAIPCPFFEDASCMKGESCPMSHGTRRPLSL